MNDGVQGIWQEFHDRLRAFIATRVGNPADVDDILQEVFLRIHRHIDSLEQADRLQAWVYQIARNAIVDHYRTPSTRREVPSGDPSNLGELAHTAPPNEDASPAELRRELTACLAPLIDRLPEDYRQAIRLTELEEVPQNAAAGRLGLSVSGMKSRVQRARQQLRAMLLDCCHLEFDRRGGVVNYRQVRGPSCGSCGPRG